MRLGVVRPLIIPFCVIAPDSGYTDTIQLQLSNNPGASIPLSGEGIAWKSDLDVRFKNPDTPTGDICDAPYFSPFSSTKVWTHHACISHEAYLSVTNY
jgi:hypothetical protein